MTELFVRLEVGWLDHPTLIDLGVEARGSHAVALVLAKRLETDGWIVRPQLIREGVKPDMIDLLVDRGLLEADGDEVRPSGWLDRNISQKAIDAKRRKQSTGGKAGNHERWNHDGPFGTCPICHPQLAPDRSPVGTPIGDRSVADDGDGADGYRSDTESVPATKPQVRSGGDRLGVGTPIGSDRSPVGTPSPETETESESETTTTTPVDNSTTPAPAPTVVVEIDEQKIRRTAVAVGTAVAAEADASNPAAYAAQVTRRILRGDDPTDRGQIRARLEAGETPEQIAADWRTSDPAAASDSLTGAIGRHPAATEARNPLTVPRSTNPGCATCEGMGQFFDPADDVARPCPECRPDPIPNIRLVETS